MFDEMQNFLTGFGVDGNAVLLAGIGIGCFVGLVGLYGAFSAADTPSRRFRASGFLPGTELIKERDSDPSTLMRALVPGDRVKRSQIRRDLAHAGFTGRDAVLNFFLIRALFAIALPGTVLGLAFLGSRVPLPDPLGSVTELSQLKMLQLLGILVAIGFYGPTYWLRAKASARRNAISNGFPNALDLLQISVEAGLGFDAAVTRVADELRKVSPEISEEFETAQREILAGRDRDKALMDMAERMNFDEASSFVNVIMQSRRFGTHISEALLTYAEEMRGRRELRAQEKANKLPVQMSGVLACLMLPALFLICLTPVVIRYMHFFAQN